MATLSDEQMRALRFLAHHPGGCTEATLLKQGLTRHGAGHLTTAVSLGRPRTLGTSEGRDL
jgi:hypothetical protein